MTVPRKVMREIRQRQDYDRRRAEIERDCAGDPRNRAYQVRLLDIDRAVGPDDPDGKLAAQLIAVTDHQFAAILDLAAQRGTDPLRERGYTETADAVERLTGCA